MLESTRPHLEAVVAEAQAEGKVPSLVAGVVRDGSLVWSTGRGTSVRPGGHDRPDHDTQYRIGSITKTLTAALILQLRDEGELDLNDRVGAHVPEGPFADAVLRDLLSHRAGIPAEPRGPWWERSRGGSYDELVKANADASRVLPVAERYHYSNTAFGVLARVVEVRRGQPWMSAVDERLLRPLGMSRTTYAPEAPHAQGYSVDALTGTLTAEPHQDTGAMAPAGQLWSTADDLARWGSLLLGGRPDVLGGSALTAMSTPHSADPDERLAGAYGLGLRLGRTGERLLIGHTGSMPGFLAALFVDPESRVGAIVLANTAYGIELESLPRQLIDTTLAHEPVIADEWEATTSVPEAHAELVGMWHWGNSPFRMTTDGARLSLTPLGGDGGFRFEQTGTDSYRGLSGYQNAEMMRVVRRADGGVSHLDIGTFCYTRLPYDPRVDYPGRADEPAVR
ncbi:serine hydrolase domain-containing protein [Solicola gregarius]|uniref:Beta-lactamase family protein n=1 Tax=Solicola gregarius TaxID=2908642 RepID=A0AA46TGW6_9ACTN|nr:serine hydrolase domain-containing protein [Solicola gregarius]UYM05139.1 beta-lactamase family protein [Solicola gregarius]